MSLHAAAHAFAGPKDHRGSPRRRTFRSAVIAFNDGNSTVDVTVRDVSDTGARVRVQAVVDCPKEVTLKLADGTIHKAEVRWYRNLELGLKFLGEAGAIGSASALRAWGLYREAEKLTPAALMRDMRAQHFLGDKQLEALGAEWERLQDRFLAQLHLHCCTKPDDRP